mmetsp:Transcript_86200/g.230875  ORF Transcript_86200/g.230875 Transcript_86200/m.230875 type:complete len:233 (+) Transcript_86200:110-808(+)
MGLHHLLGAHAGVWTAHFPEGKTTSPAASAVTFLDKDHLRGIAHRSSSMLRVSAARTPPGPGRGAHSWIPARNQTISPAAGPPQGKNNLAGRLRRDYPRVISARRRTVRAACWTDGLAGSVPAPIPEHPWRPPAELQIQLPQMYPQWMACPDAATAPEPPPRSGAAPARRLPIRLSSEGKADHRSPGQNEASEAPAPPHPKGDALQSSSETLRPARRPPSRVALEQEGRGRA